MSTNYTENYNLSQWEKTDKVLMQDFNADNAKIDAALMELQTEALRLYCGSYKGTGTTPFSFAIPFKPKVMFVQKTVTEDEKLIVFGDNSTMIAQAMTGTPYCKYNGDSYNMTITDNSVQLTTGFVNVVNPGPILNQSGVTYMFFLLG